MLAGPEYRSRVIRRAGADRHCNAAGAKCTTTRVGRSGAAGRVARVLLNANWYTRTCTNMSPAPGPSLPPRTVAQWRELVAGGGDPLPWLVHCRAAALASAELHLWISLPADALWRAQLALLSERLAEPLPRAELVRRYPLLGVPFAAKDNIDVAGVPTTAACPAFAYVPQRQRHRGAAPARRRRAVAGQDQPRPVRHRAGRHAFALRRPSSAFDADAHQRRLQLGLGRGRGSGPGRVLAGHRHGRLGPRARGFQRPRRSEAHAGARQHRRRGAGLPQPGLRVGVRPHGGRRRAGAGVDRRSTTRRTSTATSSPGPALLPAAPRIGVPKSPTFFGDAGYAPAFAAAIERARATRPAVVRAGFRAAVRRGGAAVRRPVGGRAAQRRARAVGQRSPRPSTRWCASVIAARPGLQRHGHFRGPIPAAALQRELQAIWQQVDLLMVPTAPGHPHFDELDADPLGVNARLGTYTNFVNLLGWCALALPAGSTASQLPFGVTFIAAGSARRGAGWLRPPLDGHRCGQLAAGRAGHRSRRCRWPWSVRTCPACR